MALNRVKYLFASLILFFSAGAFAEDPPVSAPVVKQTKSKKTKKPKKSQNQIEGTKALDKGEIEAEPVIRSHYEKNGEKLEVDPD